MKNHDMKPIVDVLDSATNKLNKLMGKKPKFTVDFISSGDIIRITKMDKANSLSGLFRKGIIDEAILTFIKHSRCDIMMYRGLLKKEGKIVPNSHFFNQEPLPPNLLRDLKAPDTKWELVQKPIYRMHDINCIGVGMYSYGHVDFDGAPDYHDGRSGVGRSEAECKEMIDEYWDSIDWILGESLEVIKNDWACYLVTGEDENGHEYYGTMQTFISQPKIIPNEIEDIQTS